MTLGVRPEHLAVESGGNEDKLTSVKVDLVEQLGGNTLLYATIADGQGLAVSLDGQREVENGAAKKVFVDSSRCHLFDKMAGPSDPASAWLQSPA